MPLVPFVTDTVAQTKPLNDALDNAIRTRFQSADQIRNNTLAFLASPDLVFPVVVGATYVMKAKLYYQSSIIADFLFRLALPFGTTGVLAAWSSSAGTTDSALYHNGSTSVLDVFSEGAGTSTMMCIRPVATFTIGNVAGNIVGQFSQSALDPTETRLKLGSTIRLSRVA